MICSYMRYGPRKRCSKLRRFASRALRIGTILYLLACLGCASWQRSMMYFPPVFDPAKANELGAAAKVERWNSPTGEALGWKRLSPVQPAAGQVLVLHGNAGCAIWCSRFADAIQQIEPFDVFMVEYPGYADRPGKPTEARLEQSAAQAFEHLSAKSPIYLVGESLGTGVATYLAGKYPHRIQGVVLLGPFNSMVDLGKYHAPALPVALILCDR